MQRQETPHPQAADETPAPARPTPLSITPQEGQPADEHREQLTKDMQDYWYDRGEPERPIGAE